MDYFWRTVYALAIGVMLIMIAGMALNVLNTP